MIHPLCSATNPNDPEEAVHQTASFFLAFQTLRQYTVLSELEGTFRCYTHLGFNHGDA